MTAYCNNLTKGDLVSVVSLNRRGVVASQPRATSKNVQVYLDGTRTARYFQITDLRYIVDGVPEDVAPFDGELPESFSRSIDQPTALADSSLGHLLKRRRELVTKLTALDEVIFEWISRRQ